MDKEDVVGYAYAAYLEVSKALNALIRFSSDLDSDRPGEGTWQYIVKQVVIAGNGCIEAKMFLETILIEEGVPQERRELLELISATKTKKRLPKMTSVKPHDAENRNG